MKTILGDLFYKYTEESDTLETIRLIKFKNENTFVFLDLNNNTKRIMSKTILENEFTRIKPDGNIAFAIVQLECNVKDVIVTLYRKEDLEAGDNIPYCACRQNVFDLFTNQIQKDKERMYVGVSVSKETMLEGTPYEMMLACNGMVQSTMVSYYIGDTLEGLLSFVNPSKYDAVLQNLSTSAKDSIMGYCTTLKQLLVENDFMYDVLRGYNIHRVDFVPEVNENNQLNVEQTNILEDILKVQILDTCVLEFDKEINLKKIERDYVLISDTNNKVYLVSYIKGDYKNETFKNMKDKRDAVAMLKYKKINK